MIKLIFLSLLSLANTKDHILKNKKISDRKAHDLSEIIDKYSKIYNIDPILFSSIIMQESTYNLKAIKKTCGYKDKKETCLDTDFGISQIHYKTALSYKFDIDRLTRDLDYSVESGFIVLSYFKKKYEKTEKNWYCRYNVGTAKKEKIKEKCLNYVKLIKRHSQK
jgi:soluble lytic murein transglycosylase-like protein